VTTFVARVLFSAAIGAALSLPEHVWWWPGWTVFAFIVTCPRDEIVEKSEGA
jgi:hypothetical protein